MRHSSNALLAGAALLAICGAGTALAQTPQVHVMTVQLPGGGTAEIRYAGDVAPRVTFGTAPAPIDMFSAMPALFGPDSSFAMLDRVSAAMDRQAAAMFRQADRLMADARSGQLTQATLGDLPPGSRSYTFVSTMSGNGVCSRSVEIRSTGSGAPRVERHSSGNCAARPGGAGSVVEPAVPPGAASSPVWTSVPAPASRPDVVWTGAAGAKPYAGLVREIPPAQR